mgnify:CR=1 FL=1
MLLSHFLSFYKPNDQNAKDCYLAVEHALWEEKILTPLTLIGALATVRIEVGKNYKPIREYASGEAYEGRRDLGNTEKGDGVRYAGRGLIQITGRANYALYGKRLGIDLLGNPDLALDLKVSAKILAMYFKDRKVNMACDVKDWEFVRRKVNGGLNGYTEFLDIVNQFLSKL